MQSVPTHKLTAKLGALNVCLMLLMHGAMLTIFFITPAWVWPFAFVVYQRVVSEWMHEGAHFNVYPNRRANDWILNLLACPLLFEPIEQHREKHLIHHRKSTYFIPEDPDTEPLIIQNRSDFWKGVFSDLFGITAARQILKAFVPIKKPLTTTNKPRRTSFGRVLTDAVLPFLLCHFFLIAVLLFFGASVTRFYAFHFLSLFTLYPLLNRIRVYCQHLEILSDGTTKVAQSKASRTICAGLLDQLVFNSRLMIYHTDHHKFPALHYRALYKKFKPVDDPNVYATSRWRLLIRLYRGLPI